MKKRVLKISARSPSVALPFHFRSPSVMQVNRSSIFANGHVKSPANLTAEPPAPTPPDRPEPSKNTPGPRKPIPCQVSFRSASVFLPFRTCRKNGFYQDGPLVRKIKIFLPSQLSGKENQDFLTKPAPWYDLGLPNYLRSQLTTFQCLPQRIT